MYRVLTVSREYGSGGGSIAAIVAKRLGWRLLDRALVQEIARRAQVEPELVRQLDEKTDSWLHRVSRRALWHGGMESVASVTESDFCDAEMLAALSTSLIREAHQRENCVIVGHGAQCVLQKQPDVFHTYVYAPWAQRVQRIRGRVPGAAKPEDLIIATDKARADYTRLYFGAERTDPHLYDLMISSTHGDEQTASVILAAMQQGEAG